jgi:RNase P/RNase MRP subunit p29
VGVAGIVAMETENTFKIVREDDVLCTVPKRGCTFRLCVGSAVIRLFGRAICQRCADRASKKFKSSRKSTLL